MNHIQKIYNLKVNFSCIINATWFIGNVLRGCPNLIDTHFVENIFRIIKLIFEKEYKYDEITINVLWVLHFITNRINDYSHLFSNI